MTNRIMELAYDYAASCERRELTGRVYARVALSAEIKAQQDYTRAVISERDQLRTWNDENEYAAQVAEAVLFQRSCEMESLRKTAQMALEALTSKYIVGCGAWVHQHTQAADALRKELGQ